MENGTIQARRCRKLSHNDRNKTLDEIWGEFDGTCRVCGEETGKYNSKLRHYCSERCKRIAYAVQDMFTWDVVKAEVRNRDNHTCQDCGKDRESNNYNGLHVHHIISIKEGGHPFDEENLITLCPSCHRKRHGKDSRKDDIEQLRKEHIPLSTFMEHVETEKRESE